MSYYPSTISATYVCNTASSSSALSASDRVTPSSSHFSVVYDIPTPSSFSVAERTLYLMDLRATTELIQARVNEELTLLMEEDRAREAAATGGAAVSAEDEAREEQNYGEEMVDDE